MITNTNVYSGAEIINETINEVIISDMAVYVWVMLFLGLLFHVVMFRKINKIEKKLKVIEKDIK